MMEPTGDVQYVTCGPFNCADGMDAPVPSLADSAVCTAWDPTVEFEIGKVDNDVLGPGNTGAIAEGSELESNDGIDLGIVTSSTLEMNVKHLFDGVTNGTNTSKIVEAATGTDKILEMSAIGGPAFITVNAEVDDTATENINESVVCDNTYASEDVSLKEDRPGGKNCFRLIGPGANAKGNDPSEGANYLAGWTIELSPVDADVTWGNVDWEEDPFEDLTCGASDPIVVADRVDVCSMFDDEVAYATGRGWDPADVVFDGDNRVMMWTAKNKRALTGEKMFKSIWFDDNLNGAILKDNKAGAGAQADRMIALGEGPMTPSTSGLHRPVQLQNEDLDDGHDRTTRATSARFGSS